jgi:hypothetical protein
MRQEFRALVYNNAFTKFVYKAAIMAIPTSMADRDGVIWYDGKMVNWRDATTHVLTHTLHYGMGVFEGVRA